MTTRHAPIPLPSLLLRSHARTTSIIFFLQIVYRLLIGLFTIPCCPHDVADAGSKNLKAVCLMCKINPRISLCCVENTTRVVFFLWNCVDLYLTTSFQKRMMSPHSLSWIVPPENGMKKLLIVVCVVYILPYQKQLYFCVRSRKIKPRPPASGNWCWLDLRADDLWSGM
jgi:hypothetical protein